MKAIYFQNKEVSTLDSFFQLHKFQFELKNQYPTVRIYDYSVEQFTAMVNSTFRVFGSDPIYDTLLEKLIASYDPSRHVYGEIYFDVRLLVIDDNGELALTSYDKYPWSTPISIMFDRRMFGELFRPTKFPQDIEREEGEQSTRVLEAESIHRIYPEWDAYTGVLGNLMIMEKTLTDTDVVFKSKEKLETFINAQYSDVEGVPAHRMTKRPIYDVRLCNISTDRYDRGNKLNIEESIDLSQRVEEWKQIKTWKDLPDKSESHFITGDQNFYGVDVHVSGDARARITIADKQVSLKYWNKEQVAALYVDAALRTHSSFIKDWEKKLNFPNLKQIVVCCCPICQKGKKFPRRSSQYPDNLIYTNEYKERFNPEDL